jgi:translation initiation factor IF-2
MKVSSISIFGALVWCEGYADYVTGTIISLKNQKKDVEIMRKDTECGISFEGWDAFKVGDRIQCYEEKEEKRKL